MTTELRSRAKQCRRVICAYSCSRMMVCLGIVFRIDHVSRDMKEAVMRVLILGLLFLSPCIDAQPVSGRVTSAEEGAMEGVLVSAKKAGSTITITVVSDAQGRYRFPSARMEPGEYSLRIRAIGYDLDRPVAVDVRGEEPAEFDLKLRKT